MTEATSKQPATLSRDALYALVWETPMSKLAPRFGISGNGLAKVCRRLDVPYPGRGYWARKAAGKKVSQAPLPKRAQDTPEQVRIAPTPEAPSKRQPSPELEAALAAAREQIGRVAVPARLARPHPIVAGWIEERRRRRQEAREHPWYRSYLMPADFTPLERRRHRILSVLCMTLEKHGFKATLDERGRLCLEIDKEPAEITLKEKYRQIRRALTDEEKRQGYNPKRPWKQETQPTGRLEFRIDTHLHPAIKHIWIDEPEQPLEQQLSEIAAVFVVSGPILQERRRHREECEKRRHAEELRRYEEQQKAQQDRNRWRHFVLLAQRWHEAEATRKFLTALEGKLDGGDARIDDQTTTEWIEWARAHLAEYDPLAIGAESILQEIADVNSWTYRDSINQS